MSGAPSTASPLVAGPLPGVPDRWRALMLWLLLLGEPGSTPARPDRRTDHLGQRSSACSACLAGWSPWPRLHFKERTVARGTWLDIVALVALLGYAAAMAFHVMQTTKRITQVYKVGPIPAVTLLAPICGLILFIWVEGALWRTIMKILGMPAISPYSPVHVAPPKCIPV